MLDFQKLRHISAEVSNEFDFDVSYGKSDSYLYILVPLRYGLKALDYLQTHCKDLHIRVGSVVDDDNVELIVKEVS